MSTSRRFDWLFRPRDSDADDPLSAEARFAEALAGLPPVERSALALSELGGLDQEEIAARLGTDPVVVGRLLNRARDAVRASLAANGRRVVGALTPVQAWWQSGASAPAIPAAGIAAVAVLGVGFVHDARSTAPRPEGVSPARHGPTLVDGAPASKAKTIRVRRAVASPVRTTRPAPAPVASPAAAAATPGPGTPWVARVKPRPPARRQASPVPRPAPPVTPVAAEEAIVRTVTLVELPRVAEPPPLPALPVEPPLPDASVPPPAPLPPLG